MNKRKNNLFMLYRERVLFHLSVIVTGITWFRVEAPLRTHQAEELL